MFKRQSKPAVSPLDPPPASTRSLAPPSAPPPAAHTPAPPGAYPSVPQRGQGQAQGLGIYQQGGGSSPGGRASVIQGGPGQAPRGQPMGNGTGNGNGNSNRNGNGSGNRSPQSYPKPNMNTNTNMNPKANSNPSASVRGPASGGNRGLQAPNPTYAAGSPIGRVASLDTARSEKSEKRRSGFFGLGGKKDKDTQKDRDKAKAMDKDRSRERERQVKAEEPRPRPSSFSVERPRSSNANANDFHPHTMRQFPPPQPGHTPPPLGQQPSPSPPLSQQQPRQSPVQGQQRIVSSPLQSSSSARDFGPGAGPIAGGGAFPKSQSMGFSRSPVPDKQPYRGSPSTVPEPPTQISRSSSMPLNQQQQQQQAQPSPPGSSQRAPDSPGRAALSPSMQEFEPIVDLIGMQPQKTYVASPPELEMILARTSAGGQPKQGQPGSATNDWDSVWLQLSGISLSMWSMKETRAAAAKGEKVPPTYFNVTDSSLELLAPLPPPPHRPTSHPHHFVFSLNTAGSNRLLFSCQTERDLARWATGLRLAAWERARLEEIYTGHLIKSGGKEPKNELVRGRMEGWVRVRVMGGTDWKRLWVVLSTPSGEGDKEDEKKTRRRSFFGLGEKQPETIQEPNTGVSMASFYLEPRTPKNKTSLAALTLSNVTQAYAVFPERLEVMSQSNLFKVVGRVGGDMVAVEGRLRDSGWALIMPESPADAAQVTPLSNMMRWVTGFHDVFGLYGRPGGYIWDEGDVRSLMFAYPRGTDRENLFLTLDEAMSSDFRANQLAVIRSQYTNLMQQKQTAVPDEAYLPDGEDVPTPRLDAYRLPPLPFASSSPQASEQSGPRSLTPITEQSIDIGDPSRQNSTRTQKSSFWVERAGSGSGSGGGGGHQAQKQSSGGSLRLATIADDGGEPFGQFTDEPQHESTVTTPGSISASTNETKHTASSMWSQPSAQTAMPDPEHQVNRPGAIIPEPQSRSPSQPYGGGQSAVSFGSRHQSPVPLSASPAVYPHTDNQQTSFISSTGEPAAAQQRSPPTQSSPPAQSAVSRQPQTLPEVVVLSGSRVQREPQSQPTTSRPIDENDSGTAYSSVTPVQPAPVEAPSPASPPPVEPLVLAPPVSPPAGGPRGVLSPTPRRVSTGEAASPAQGALHEEPAAMYLMNMVEDDEPRIADTLASRARLADATDINGDGVKPSESLGRKPSGARAPPPKKSSSGSRHLEAISDEPQPQPEPHLPASSTQTDLGEDATAFMAYAEQPSPAKPVAREVQPLSPPEPIKEEEMRSSFAPSRAAAERRAKAEQFIAEQQNARNVPGGGKRTGGTQTWSGSEDEDEDDSPVQQRARPIAATQASSEPPIQRAMSQTRALPPVPRPSNGYDSRQSQLQSYMVPPQSAERSRSRSPAAPAMVPGTAQRQLPQQPQQQQQQPPPPAARQTVWNANFAAEHGMPESRSGKFVELDEPAHLTAAFAPHGLLQAGIQDKEDRSAKKQEELAREMGSSLINVPAKPPPPQTGLLGAVTQHERDRKNAGGIGATLTDREREKRLAEERQRDVEKMQRQQMEHMRQFGDPNMMGMYGQQQYAPYGMMGMPPPMSYPYQGSYNPYAQQHAMMAAQMAYQQAMMAMSQSPPPPPTQGHDDRAHSPGGSASPAPSLPPFGGTGSPAPSQFAMGMGMGMGGSSPSPYAGPGGFGYGFPSPVPGMPGMPSLPSMPAMSGMSAMPPYGMWGSPAPPQQQPQPQSPWMYPGPGASNAGPNANGNMSSFVSTPAGEEMPSRLQSMNLGDQDPQQYRRAS